VHAEDVDQGILGHRVVSGTGEELGRVVGLVQDRDGRARKIAFLESDGSEPRYVPLRYIRSIRDGEIRLAGPREGYHITRVHGSLGRQMADPAEDSDDDVWAPS
jgi:hypothetical protein